MADNALDTDDLPDDATDEEAAAIAAAIAAYRSEQAAAAAAAVAASDADGERASRRSWEFTGRLAGLGIGAGRPPATTPTEGWRAASRSDRF